MRGFPISLKFGTVSLIKSTTSQTPVPGLLILTYEVLLILTYEVLPGLSFSAFDLAFLFPEMPFPNLLFTNSIHLLVLDITHTAVFPSPPKTIHIFL